MNAQRLVPAHLLCTGLLALSSATAFAQERVSLCKNTMNPALSRMVLHVERFNMFGNTREAYSETDFAQTGEGDSCRITSVRSTGAKSSRSCAWTTRMSCSLEQGKSPSPHSFTAGTSFHKGRIQWAGNEVISVDVRRGDTTAPERREVAVVKFDGTWTFGGGAGDSISTAYFDREWGVLLKIEGANGVNKFGDTVTLIEIRP